MTAILGAATKVIAAVTVLLAVVYLLFLSLVRPLEPNPDLPTFADVQERLEAGETTAMQQGMPATSEADFQALEERLRKDWEQQRQQNQ